MKGSTKLVTACVITVLFTLAILSSACFFYTGYYQRSLSYSLTQLSYSIERNDVASFDFYVDVPAVSQDLVTAAIARTQGSPSNPFAEALLPLVKATATRSLEDSINAMIAGIPVTTSAQDSELSYLNPKAVGLVSDKATLASLVKKGDIFVSNLQTEQTAMTANILFHLKSKDGKLDVPVKLTARQQPNGQWRILHINNPEQILEKLDK